MPYILGVSHLARLALQDGARRMSPKQRAAAYRRPALQLDGLGILARDGAADRAFPAAVAHPLRSATRQHER